MLCVHTIPTVYNSSECTPLQYHLNVKPVNNGIISKLTSRLFPPNTSERLYWIYMPQSRDLVQHNWVHLCFPVNLIAWTDLGTLELSQFWPYGLYLSRNSPCQGELSLSSNINVDIGSIEVLIYIVNLNLNHLTFKWYCTGVCSLLL